MAGECGPNVERIEQGKAFLADGREIETDVIVLACGPSAAKKLVSTMDEKRSTELFSPLKRISASFIEVGLDSKSLSGNCKSSIKLAAKGSESSNVLSAIEQGNFLSSAYLENTLSIYGE